MATVREKREAFHALLKKSGCEIAPSAYDGFSAQMIARAGFPAIHISGSGVHRGYGFGDVGLLTLTEQVMQATVIADIVDIPVLADGETGHGNVVNTVRAVREFERTGVAAIHIEDQETPKRPAYDGMEAGWVTKDEFVGKIKAAVDTRPDQLFAIVARIDRAPDVGFERALEVAVAAAEAGADAVWMGLREEKDQAEAARQMPKPMIGIPRRVSGWRQRYGDAGYKLALVPSVLAQAACWAMLQSLQSLRTNETEANFFDSAEGMKEIQSWFSAIGGAEVKHLEETYMKAAAPAQS
jgi:2-methylisocitrate lyase-like PEP mutase family enzyme